MSDRTNVDGFMSVKTLERHSMYKTQHQCEKSCLTGSRSDDKAVGTPF